MSDAEMPRPEDYDERVQRFLDRLSVEERLRGLSPEEILRGLSFEERLRGLSPEEILRGLSPEEILRGLSPEERLRGLSVEERLYGLSPEEIRLCGLSNEQLLPVLPVSILRVFSEDDLRSMPEHVQHAVRARLAAEVDAPAARSR